MTHISTLEGDYDSAEGQPDPHVLSKSQQEAEAISRQRPDPCSLVWGQKNIEHVYCCQFCSEDVKLFQKSRRLRFSELQLQNVADIVY